MIKTQPWADKGASLGRREMTAASDIHSLLHERKIEVKSRAVVGRTLHTDLAGVLLDDPVGYGKSQPGAAFLAIGRRGFCGEEWIVNALYMFLRNSAAGIGHPHTYSVPVGCHNPQRTSLRHRILRIQEQIEEHLLQTASIALDGGQMRGQFI